MSAPDPPAPGLAQQAQLLEERFRGLLEAAPDAMVVVDPQGRVLLVNAQTEALFGYSRQELLGALIEILVPERYRAAHPGHRQAYFHDPRTRPMGPGLDLRGRRRDGTEFPAEISLSPMITDLGALAIAAIRDVTARQKVQEKFRGLLEAAPDAMVIVNGQGTIELVNGQAEKLFGYSRSELLGQPVEMLVPRRFRDRHPAHRQGYFDERRVRGMGEGLELYGVKKDGTEFPVEISLSPLDTEGGALVSSAIRDVSERRRLEEIRRRSVELEEDRKRFRRLVQSDIIGIYVGDFDGRIHDANDHFLRIVGYGREDLGSEALRLDRIVPPEERIDHERAVQQLMDSGIPSAWETQLLRRDGGRVPVLFGIARLDDERGCIGYVLDISERKRMEEERQRYAEELARSNRELESFAYVASHDLQEPLRTVTSFVQLLERRYQGRLDADADDFLGIITAAAQRMQALILDLLAFSRLGTRGRPFEPVNCGEVLAAALHDLHAAIEASGARVEAGPLPVVVGDDVQLGQVFRNLVDNAIKFRRPGAPVAVQVSAERSGRDWVFSFADNGIGIEPQYFDRIFGVFQRLHGREEYPGTGIGLAVCKKVVERHGGRIWVESRPGEGTTFRLTLPGAEGPA
jgi:PAS domain S-box-containing protein